jgi:hypothetical protein
MKTCTKCHLQKELEDFNKNKTCHDGRETWCRECKSAYMKLYARTEKGISAQERWKAKMSIYYKVDKSKKTTTGVYASPEEKGRADRFRRYQQTDKGKEAFRRAASKYREKYPEKRACTSAFHSALLCGKILRPEACQECERSDVVLDGHHENYNQPLNVMWLCRKCHRSLHERKKSDVTIAPAD